MIYGRLMDDVWKIDGRLMARIWMIYGWLLKWITE
jgi:hypothetical protein